SYRGRWTLIGLACLVVLLIGLLTQGFLSSSAPAVAPRAAGDGLGSFTTPPASPEPSPSKTKANAGGNGQLVTDPVQRLRNVLPDNPLNHLPANELHNVTVSASAGRSIPVLGFLIPTGLGTPYGAIKHHSHWSMSEQALGKGYLAA